LLPHAGILPFHHQRPQLHDRVADRDDEQGLLAVLAVQVIDLSF